MKRKYAIPASIIFLMLALLTGCGNTSESENKDAMFPAAEKVDESTGIQTQDNEEQNHDTEIPDDTTSESPLSNTETDNDSSVTESSSENDNNVNQESMFIGGKVRSVAQDSFVLSRTLYDDEDKSLVIIPEEGSPEEELVTVLCTDSTTFEHWTIQGGGAGITKKEAAFSDIKEKDGLEAFGYFDQDVFIAEKVIIELYE